MGTRLENVRDGNLGCLARNVNHFAAIVEPAVRARIVGQLLLVAVGAGGQGERRKEIVCTTLVLARMRVTSFWIGHCKAPNLDRPVGTGPNTRD